MDGFDAGWDSEALSPNYASSAAGSLLRQVSCGSGSDSEDHHEKKKTWWSGFVGRWMALPATKSTVSRGKRKRRQAQEENKAKTGERDQDLWKALDAAVHLPIWEGGNTGKGSERSPEKILLAAIKRVRALQVDNGGLIRDAMLLVPKEAALLVLNVPSCKIMHSGNAFDDLGAWLCSDGLRGIHFTNLLHPDDAMQFKVFVSEILQAVKTAPSRHAALASQVPTTRTRSLVVRCAVFCGVQFGRRGSPRWAMRGVTCAQKHDAPQDTP